MMNRLTDNDEQRYRHKAPPRPSHNRTAKATIYKGNPAYSRAQVFSNFHAPECSECYNLHVKVKKNIIVSEMLHKSFPKRICNDHGLDIDDHEA